ncbi:MAG: transporter substrate-binding domain-containing protein [Spirochaetaceae bacterium]|jgi:L-cystine transport system substrate-binding protein|nr:transporter substrate-binding domain-containing protein [Spirochaetaceae bacterium]
MKKLGSIAVLLIAVAGFGFASPRQDTGGSRTIRVGTEGAYPPYNYVTEAGEADGYDVAVVRAVGELIPELEFEFIPTAWDGIFVALEGGAFNLIASDLAWRPEREEKYYLSTVPYLWGGTQIVYKAGRRDIRSLADLNGKKVAAGVGTNTTTELEQYIARTGARIEIVYTDGNIVNALTEIETGRVDATLSSIITTQLTADSLGYKIEGVTASELPANSIHLLFPKTEEGRQLRDRMDGALKTLLDNGTLASLSQKYFFGKDYSTREALEANR